MRTVVEVDTAAGITGLGEMGGGGESAEAAIRGLERYWVGTSPFDLERQRFAIANSTASLYNNRTQLLAAIEFACIDIIGKVLDVPAYQLFGGKLRDEVRFASYLFFRNPDRDGTHEVRTIEQLVEHARALKAQHGLVNHKLKGGVFAPDYESNCYRALADALPGDSFRYDPNCALPLEDAVRFGQAIGGLNNAYFEDPTWGMNGMRQVRERTGLRTAMVPSRCLRGRGWASRWTATNSGNMPSCTRNWAAIRMIKTRAGRAGCRWCPTPIGPITRMRTHPNGLNPLVPAPPLLEGKLS